MPELPSVDLSLTAGKSIKCKGWVCEKGSKSWSPKNVAFKEDLVVPVPGPRQVRVRVYAAGVNPADTQLTTLLPGQGSGSRRGGAKLPANQPSPVPRFPYVCGFEGAGVIESVGWDEDGSGGGSDGRRDAPSSLARGDRVMFLASGSFAQYAVLDADLVTAIDGPTDPAACGGRMIDFVEAATFGVAAETAYLALFDKLRIEKGRSIFISGGSGGVGSVAVQLARYYGLYVIASCSTAKVGYLEGLGADVVLDYTVVDVVAEVLRHTEGYGVDYILECASATLAESHAEAARFGGAVCVLTGILLPTSDLVFRQQLSIHYVFLGMFQHHPAARPQLRVLARNVQTLYLQGAFTVAAEEVPLERAQMVLDVVAQGHTRGKIVLTCFHPGEAAIEEQRRRRIKLVRERSANTHASTNGTSKN